MDAHELVKELGCNLGIELALSPSGTCRASFDGDVVDFEVEHESLWLFADLDSAQNREDAVQALLAANNFGLQTGGATISLDEERSMFIMHMELWGDMPYASFEAKLIMFIKALRWWKEWLALPPLKKVAGNVSVMSVAGGAGGAADGVMENVYAPLSMSSGMLRI